MTIYEAYLISTDWTMDSTKAAFVLFITLCFIAGCCGCFSEFIKATKKAIWKDK